MSELNCLLPHRVTTDTGAVLWNHSQPRRGANNGTSYLCHGHLARLREIVASTPKAVAWMREQLEPAKGDFEKTAPMKAASKLPISAAAVDAADETLGLLCSWAEYTAESIGQPAPDMSNTWKVLASPDSTDGEMRVQGMRPDGIATVDSVSRWMLERIDVIATHDWVADFTTELCDQRATNLARWPYEERPKPAKGIECPDCGHTTLVVFTPAFAPKYSTEPLLRNGKPVEVTETVNVYDRVINPDGSVSRSSRLVERTKRYADGSPVLATVQRLNYAPPLLVQCRDSSCRATVSDAEWGRLVRQSNDKMKRRA